MLYETTEIAPRSYGLVWQRGGMSFGFSPAAYVMGNMLRLSPGVISRRLERTQRYKRRHAELLKRRKTYKPLFPWTMELLADADIASTVRGAVKKRSGYYLHFDTTPEEAVRNMDVRGIRLTGEVKAKSERTQTTSTYHPVEIKGVFLTPAGKIDIRDLTCQCEETFWNADKGSGTTRAVCVHIAAAEQEFFERFHYGDMHDDSGRQSLSPFAFAANWKSDGEPLNSHIAALESDVIVDNYCLRHGFYSINQRLLAIPEIYSAATLDAIRSGEMRFAVVRGGLKRRKISQTEAEAQHFLLGQVIRALLRHGYRQADYCLELGMPAYRFENRGHIVSLAQGEHFPLVYIVRDKGRGTPNPFAADEGQPNPYKQLNEQQIRPDDAIMTRTSFMVGVPNRLAIPEAESPIEIDIPEELKRKYVRAITGHSRRPEIDLKAAGLG